MALKPAPKLRLPTEKEMAQAKHFERIDSEINRFAWILTLIIFLACLVPLILSAVHC